MTYSITYSGFLGEKPIEGSQEVESISITGCLQNFCNKMRNQRVEIKKIRIEETTKRNESPAR
jgi:hypothetical protein